MDSELNQKNSRGESLDVSWRKQRIISALPDATLEEAALIMKQHHLGDLLVIHPENKQLLGIVTDRDIALALAPPTIYGDLKIADIMAAAVITASEGDSIFKMIEQMKAHGITRLPLLDRNQEVIGVVTARNLIEILLSGLFDLTHVADKQHEKERVTQSERSH